MEIFLVMICVVAAVRFLTRPKKPTLAEALESINILGLIFLPKQSASMEGGLPIDAGLVKAWFSNKTLSLKYWRGQKDERTLETIDFVFLRSARAGGITVCFVDEQVTEWKYSGRPMPPMTVHDKYLALQMLWAAQDQFARTHPL